MSLEQTKNQRAVSIVIPCSDDPLIGRCLESIDENIETIVSLNAPSSQVLEILAMYPNTKTITSQIKGIARAYNLGIESATHDRILLMDSDCVFSQGTIARMDDLASEYSVVKGKVQFQHNNKVSEVVARLREFTTSDQINAYSPPLLFDRRIIDQIGYYFHPSLIWSEDADFDRRVKQAGIPIGYDPEATILHKPLTIPDDLRSAFFYGVGRQIGKEVGVYSPHTFHSFVDNVAKVSETTIDIYKSKDALVAAYYLFLWNPAFRIGTFTQHYIKNYGI